ncbi:unnamed protein product [Microthlaspi erraticum]|uniref:AT3G52170-like helix-turn-helix domain-containing protein n=1 Tax=Microthlaspi erraticum TaxID=1685480 RepID=A0A6D2HXA5_9BRAS|nr:unnamed protein product [Microthlaspi erraticum]
MHSLKTSYAGQIFALAKPHESLGKRTRNRIPKEERKTLVESFIKKHQRLNNGSFPSLSLTHKEVGGSFYTIREIVREIIQENRVLGTSDLFLESNGSDHLQDQSLSSSLLMDPVPPLSLSPNGFHSQSDQSHSFSSEAVEAKSLEGCGNINGSQDASEDRGSDSLKKREVNGYKLPEEDVHESVGSTDISKTQFEASCSEENDTGLQTRVETVCDSLATTPQWEELDVDNKDRDFEEIPLIESEGTEPVNSDERVNHAGEAMAEKNTLGAIDLPSETVVETFPVSSVTSATELSDVQPNEWEKVCEGGKGTEAKVETGSSTETSVDVGEISSSIFAVPEEQGTEVIVGQMPNHISVPMENQVEEKIVYPASIDVEIADIKGTVVASPVIGNIHETGSCKNDKAKVETMSSHARNEVAIAEKATMEQGKLEASDSSSSQKGNIATLNRIKPESWKEQSNKAQETNPLLAVLKSFLTAFVKFWSE